MNFATWTNRVINESSEHYFAEELLEESIAKTLKPVVNKMKKLNIGVPYRDARLFFFNYLQDKHPEVVPAEFKDSKRKPAAKDVNAMVGQIAIERPEMLDTFANEFEAYATENVEGTDEDRVSEFLRIAMILRTGKNVRPKKDEGYKTKEYSNLSAEEIKNTTMDAIEKAPVETGEDPDVKDEKLLLKVAFTKVLAQLSELDELDPQVLVNIADTGAKIDSIERFKQFLDYMHQFEEYHLAEAYLRDMVSVLEKEMVGSEEESELDDFHTQRHSDEDIPDHLEDLHAMRSGKFPGINEPLAKDTDDARDKGGKLYQGNRHGHYNKRTGKYVSTHERMLNRKSSKNEGEEGEAKPDYLDIDGDGDKEESMKKAAKDKHAACEEAENGCTCGGCPDCADNKKRHEDNEKLSLKDEFRLTPDEMELAMGLADFDEDEWFFSPSQNLYFRKREGGEDQESTARYMSKAPVGNCEQEEAEEVKMSPQEINRLLANRERERIQNLYAQQRRHTHGY